MGTELEDKLEFVKYVKWTKYLTNKYMSCYMTKPTKWVCPQRRLRSAWASAQSDQSSLCAQWVAKDPSFLHVDSEYPDQTGWMPRLIWVIAGRTLILLVLSCRELYGFLITTWSSNKQAYNKNILLAIIMHLSLFLPSIPAPPPPPPPQCLSRENDGVVNQKILTQY